jgi:hypothetical protein
VLAGLCLAATGLVVLFGLYRWRVPAQELDMESTNRE